MTGELWQEVFKRGVGRPTIYPDAESLAAACFAYFKWASENPLTEEKAFHADGRITKTNVKKCRAFTVSGLTLFIGISDDAWEDYRKSTKFSGVTKVCDKIIRDQKFTAAAAGLLNPVIIARDLGLREITDHVSSDGSMTPKGGEVDFSKVSDAALAELMAARRPSD